MIGGKSVLAVITARGGSKGLPGKNILPLAGRPLIGWTIEAARNSRFVDRLILSSDDEGIISVARSLGCEVPFVRDAELATDTATSIDVVLDAIGRCPGHDWVVLLQPTSPLRTAADIDGTLTRCFEAGAPACVSVAPVEQSPYWMYSMRADGVLAPVVVAPPVERRQDLPRAYALNGAVYTADCRWLAQTRSFVTPQTVGYEMPAGRSIDIDDRSDLVSAENILRKSGN
jgi:CMP-N,N'-diacetyllegionaminic acid synthase